MIGFRRVLGSILLAAFALATVTSTASAQTFYVNKRNGENSPQCGIYPGGHEATKENPCSTIHEAIEKTEGTAPPNTIELSAEENPYNEAVSLTSVRDKELTIAGEEPEVVIGAAVVVKSPAGGITLTNLEVHAESSPAAVEDTGAAVRLSNVAVVAENDTNGVSASGAPLTVEGGSVTTESADGFAIADDGGALTVNGTKVENGAGGIGSEASGIGSFSGSLSVTGARIINEGSAKTTQFAITVENDSSATIRSTSVDQGSPALGVVFNNAPPTVEGLEVEMSDPASKVPAILSEGPGAASFSHVETSGKWTGLGLSIVGGSTTVSDSHIVSNLSGTSAAMHYDQETPSSGLLLQRSVVEAPIKAAGSLMVTNGDGTLDSSEVLGGHSGIVFETNGAAHQLTVAASTIGPFNGVLIEAPGPVGVEAKSSGTGGAATVAIEGSIMIESQAATALPPAKATVTCTYTAAPSQIQTANALTHAGEISCPAGSAGNTNSTGELKTLFAEPLVNYSLAPTSSAVDSVPAGAVSLPSGFTPSTTDLLGSPRVVDGNGDCVAVQDKGAFELQGHAAPCPPTPVASHPGGAAPVALAGVITALTLSPSSFRPAPKGATISKAKYGAKVSWRDSQTATTTFTVLVLTAGRKQGSSCKRPSKANRHGKRCTFLRALGTFTHTDTAGADSLHFSGRLKGHKLAAGSYVLRAVARDAAGNGKAASKAFKVL